AHSAPSLSWQVVALQQRSKVQGGWRSRSCMGPVWPAYVISWALSCCFLFSSSVSRQRRKFSSVTSALRLTVILSLLLHTSKPIKATRRPRGW
uniref:Uncharacterized protein n=1 Tax=Anser brachyrhynchus TaxID=132585 RepID=A0A8B9CQG7_9AVES